MNDYYSKTTSKTVRYGLLSFVIISMVTIGIVTGGIFAYAITSQSIHDLNTQLTDISVQNETVNQTSIQYYFDETSLSDLYSQVKDSIVVITGTISYQSYFQISYTTAQGSGFVYAYQDEYYVITNNHVISDAEDLVVTFSNGNAYAASLIGADAYSDLAVLEVDAPEVEFIALSMTSSSDIQVGNPVIAIGTPLGLDSTMTTGIVSQLGRTIEESLAGNFPIANIIQTNVAINPGNSGGPLLNYQGNVIGITTAIIEDTEGIGFAIPSDTILKEIDSLITQGVYTEHSWIGISGVDMTYAISQEIDATVTYGWLISYVNPNSAADIGGLLGGSQRIQVIDETVIIGGDIIIAIDGYRIVNGDDLMSYLESQTTPGQVITVSIERENEFLDIPIELGRRPVVS